jgi:CheY-like chemotaxis protein
LNEFVGAKELITWTRGKNHLLATPLLICHQQEFTVEQKIFLSEFSDVLTIGVAAEEVALALEVFLNKDNSGVKGNEDADNIENAVGPLKGKTVLITDDDMRNIYSLSAILEEKEMNVIIAGNGKEAFEKLEAHPQIEIVLMDIMMPAMDGYEALIKIRSEERWKKLPVIALTANALTGTRDKCMALGANGYLSKPINSEQLVNILEVWLND